MVFRADGMNGKKAKKLFASMTKSVPGCAFAVVSLQDKSKVALFCACGKGVDAALGGAKGWASKSFPEGRGGGNAAFASSTGDDSHADSLMARAEKVAAELLQ